MQEDQSSGAEALLGPRHAHAAAILLTAPGLGIAGDLLLRQVPWGLNLSLFISGALATAVLLARRCGVAPGPLGIGLAGAALALAAMAAWRDSRWLQAYNLLIMAGLLMLAAAYARSGSLARGTVSGYALAGLGVLLQVLVAPLLLVFHDLCWRSLDRGWWRQALAIGRGLALALPLLVVFGGLFSAADATFEAAVRQVLRLSPWEALSHLVVAWVVAWGSAGLLRAALVAEPWQAAAYSARWTRLGLVEIGLTLGLLNALFAAFTLTQLRYLFGGGGLVGAADGPTYSEYARRGFFELVWVTALVLPVLLTARTLLRPGRTEERCYRWLAAALLALLALVMASALQRMALYVEGYGLTEARLYPTAFMLWLGICVAWFASTVLRGQAERFVGGALIGLVGVLLALNLASPDALVVRFNLGRAEAAEPLDVCYLTSLGGDAVPALLEALPSLPPASQAIVARRLLERWAGPGNEHPLSWSLSRAQARAAVASQQPGLEAWAADAPASACGRR